ncbi:MAG: hypothetical protein HY716_04780, partial [Planctomycetes bacterium]|nr:hypothetical protein [Planctomycetota bacterium]
MGHFGRGRDRGLRGILILAASIGAAVLTSAGPSLGAAAPEGPLRCAVGGPDAYGYQFIDSQEPDGPVFADEWENISSTGTAVNFAQLQNQPYGAGDEGEALVPLGFPFRFYGNEYTQCYVITNGLVKFGSPGAAYAWTPGTIPSAGGDDNKICVKWQDWIGTTARYATLGTSPNQRFVVNWVLGGNNVELKLHENGDIIMLYQSVSGGGTAGIEDSTGAVGLSYAPPNSLVANRAVRFYAGYPPNPPTGLLQAAEAGGPAWPVNFISDATVYLRGTVTDPDT